MIQEQIILFIVMFAIAMLFNMMNAMAYDLKHIYLSMTLIYGSLFMASNMIWGHQIVHALAYNHFNKTYFFSGIFMSILFLYILRIQLFVNDRQWMKSMIRHHSTALTTSKVRINSSSDPNIKLLASNIYNTQIQEIEYMKKYLSSNLYEYGYNNIEN
jgi:hypothetical protein